LDTTKLKEAINKNVSESETRETKDAANRLLNMKDSRQTDRCSAKKEWRQT
jgi:hypothetical protein